jgi:hypothetical protein
MFTLTTPSASDDYNRGRRDEQAAVENLLEFLVLKRQLHPDTLNLLIEHLCKIDRRARRERQ